MKWLNRFLIFLLIVLVAISIGLSIYYFLRNNETFSFDAEEGQSITKYVNIGEPFDITVIRNNPSKDSYSLKSMDESIVKLVEKVDENVFRFEAVSGGQTTIQLETTNTAYKNLNVTVFVGDGTEENPYFVRNYQDLSTIGTGTVDGRTLEANYRQVADIDMSVATTAWTPIGATSSTGFNGKYDGNGHTISNLNLLADCNDILKLTFDGKSDRFDWNVEPHYHVLCECCGSVTDLYIEPLKHIDVLAESAFDGRISGHTIQFRGLCEKCVKLVDKTS